MDFATRILTTNSDNPVKVEVGHRRFVIIEIPSEKMS